MKKEWNIPAIETLSLVDTMSTARTGDFTDGYRDNDDVECYDLYDTFGS